MPLPLLALLALSGGSGLLSGLVGQHNADEDRKLTKEQLAQREREGLRDVALTESTLDPFRQQLAQGRAAGQLDLMERADFTPASYAPTGRYAGVGGQRTGGFSYTPSPELRAGAGALKTSVLSGRTAPSMTDPANYGKSAVLDLLGVAAGTKDPRYDTAFADGPPIRQQLGQPPAAPSELDYVSFHGRNQLRKNDSNKLAIRSFEQAHPGWTIDPVTGETVRKGA